MLKLLPMTQYCMRDARCVALCCGYLILDGRLIYIVCLLEYDCHEIQRILLFFSALFVVVVLNFFYK